MHWKNMHTDESGNEDRKQIPHIKYRTKIHENPKNSKQATKTTPSITQANIAAKIYI